MRRRTTAFTIALGIALVMVSSAAMAQYQLTNLVSNQVGQAKHVDPLLVNGWGLAYGPGGPFWVNDQGSGWSTIYDNAGVKQSLQVAVPSASGSGPGMPSGLVFNGSQDFQIQGGAAVFIFATLDGTISGWVPSVNFNEALIAVNNPGAVYTGLAVTSHDSGNMLFAADAANNKVDMYDATLTWVGSFTDSTVPAGFAPFGIDDIGGLVFVSFAAQDGGPGGFIDIYSEAGVFLKQLTSGSPLNQPWGFAAAPKNFGALSNTLLISNNVGVNGKINAFNTLTGEFVGALKDVNGKVIQIDGLWAIKFGGGSGKDGVKNTLFFTAGPGKELAGTFGKITVVK